MSHRQSQTSLTEQPTGKPSLTLVRRPHNREALEPSSMESKNNVTSARKIVECVQLTLIAQPQIVTLFLTPQDLSQCRPASQQNIAQNSQQNSHGNSSRLTAERNAVHWSKHCRRSPATSEWRVNPNQLLRMRQTAKNATKTHSICGGAALTRRTSESGRNSRKT